VSVSDPMEIKLSSADRVFDYRLSASQKEVACSKKDESVLCDVAQLKLKQSQKYDFRLTRFFADSAAGNLFENSLLTVENVRVVKSSVTKGQIIYDVPKQFSLTLNREAASAEEAKLYQIKDQKRQSIPIDASIEGKKLIVRFKEPLARSTSFVFEVKRIKAADGGFLAKPYSLNFSTSGGPKVAGINIGNYAVSSGGRIVISFDSPVSASQNIGQFVQVLSGNQNISNSVSISGNQVVVTPQVLGRCMPFTVKVLDGIKNKFGISGGSAWQFNSRTLCQTIFGIGTSVLGRSLTAYKFGSGSEKIIFVGTTHGDEKSSTYLLNSWISYLEANAHRIPGHRSIIVIPNLNPDGFAANTRTNAHNVDLNRNFPANNWKKGVTMPDLTFNPNGGGSTPLSEPESKALANYVLGQSPKLVLTYHSAGGVVIPNDAGNSQSKASIYDDNANVRYMSNSQTGVFFPYDTTGALEDWLHDKPGIPALLIELWTHSSNEFNGHVNAMWAMITH
ncbi:MAG: DUF2817 domain-containing protein, partial [Acidobacteriota bacterium]